MQANIIVIICGILGVLFSCLLTLKGLLKDAQVANVDFNWKKDYVKKDSPSILLSFLAVGIWYYIFGEVAAKYPGIADFKRVSFVLMGGVGSHFIQMAFGTAKARIRRMIDKKTNELNEMKGLTSDAKTKMN